MAERAGKPSETRATDARERVVLAHEAAVVFGPLTVSPALRQITHADGREEIVEPKVMEVLVVLLRAGGGILTRDDLCAAAWDGRIVGDDAINRVLGRLRRLCDGIAAGILRVETITKVGYRLLRLTDATAAPPAVGAPAAEQAAAIQQAPPIPAAALLPLVDRPSIAVMPFANLSADPEQEYFVDAVSEEVISALSRWRWFFVIARNSSFSYKGRGIDVRQVGAELGVRYIVSGSVRRVGDRVRISVELADTVDGARVWGDRFDRDFVDVLALQDEITEQIVRAVEPALLTNENTRLARKSPKDYSAIDCFQRGLWHFNKISRDHYDDAIANFRDCIARDPELAAGHIGLSRILYVGATFHGWSMTPDDDLQQAYDEAQTAIRLDPGDSDGHFAFAGAALYLNRHSEALAAARRSVALNPNSAYGQFRLAQVLIYAGSPAEAIEPMERSLRQNPFDPQLGAMIGGLSLAYYQSHDYPGAERHARAAIEHDFAGGHALLAASLARLGRLSEARLAMPPHLLSEILKATVRLATYANDADRDHFIEGMQLATAGAID